MARVWRPQEAKNKFSEVVEEALKHGPQVITKRGKETLIVLSYADYRKMDTRKYEKIGSVLDFILTNKELAWLLLYLTLSKIPL